jgi:hypothetical protein
MKKKATPRAEAAHDTMRPEYDFSGGVRGKHAAALRQGYTQVVHHADGSRELTEVRPLAGSIVLDPDVQAYFPDAEAVNTALRGLIALRPRRPRRKAAS